ncbi:MULTISPECIES: ABC transporter permease [Pseudomonas]|uniref:ABC transporter permease n=1 Tax=Pseudomonas TaxID=286 RepID=UPI0004D4098A|nr:MULTISPECIES: ABC transporter permease [Pseudomonas]KES24576.1 sugar ABC transporter permease [Pseudomonas sp. AAC]MBH3431411.1 ABC transporter permease [Pseudomonas citronellolis]OHR90540.1 sugar ABC transporter permease [Pseudomonas sp. HMSC75E02]
MRQYSIAPLEIPRTFWRNRSLILQLTRREIAGRYKGSFLGTLWSFFNPILMLTVYTFVFSVVFKARWGGSGASKTEFALILFAGLIIFNIFAETFTKAPNIVLYSANYVKKIIFPLEILPIISLATSLFHGLVSFLVWFIFHIIIFGVPHPQVLYFPLVVLPLLMATLGLSWLLASAGVYLRDVSQVIGILTTALMFLSPIFYPLSSLPTELQPLFMINPLTSTIEQTRAVLIFGQQPDWYGLGISMLVASLILWLGFAWFQKTRKGFADVL